MNIILGGGLAGLAAAQRLGRAGCRLQVIEKNTRVGGLARTISHGNFRFDLGGHRFLADNPATLTLVQDMLGEDLLCVPRSSQIYMGGKFVDYPLNPGNAIAGLGLTTVARIAYDYGREKISNAFVNKDPVSLQDWVVANFGRRMFDLYFKDYSEKVWGLDCRRISMDWVAKRIDGLSLWQAVKYALFHLRRQGCKTLTDSFYYPRHGIGQLAEGLGQSIGRDNFLHTATEVEHIFHVADTITGIELKKENKISLLRGKNYLSSIPLTLLIKKMSPQPPADVLAAAAKISFRSLVVVTLMLKRQKVSDLTWLYFPDKDIPFGRIHEPTNWSRELAPAGHTHLVAEYFCDRNDGTWNSTDAKLIGDTAQKLQAMNFFKRREMVDGCVLRIPHAYPVFNVGYQENLQVITDWLAQFTNLQLIGRSGSYSYLNMDHAMESGMAAAEKIIQASGAGAGLSFDEKLAALPCCV